uniref:Sirohydrochlorin ferrochelatase n=1 Tax=Streptomyces marincola TaxID=2878388 RepID=A0A1X9PY27_9ACTN|nr:hypothetical protein [Streptomyces marincola]
MTAPEGAPALVLAVPGSPSAAGRGLAEEIVSIARSELPGLQALIAFVESKEEEFPSLADVLGGPAADEEEPAGPPPVVVPLLASPDSAYLDTVKAIVRDSGVKAGVTDALGPHPLLAEAVHVRLSEAGLARADRARLFTVATAADGIVLGTVGGQEAVQAAGITGMLLSARLAVPVLAAALDEDGSVAQTAQRLREAGSQQLALAPCLIGPELPEGLLAIGAEAAGCPAAEPLGAYPAVGRLVLSAYMAEVGISPQSPSQGAPVR